MISEMYPFIEPLIYIVVGLTFGWVFGSIFYGTRKKEKKKKYSDRYACGESSIDFDILNPINRKYMEQNRKRGEVDENGYVRLW